MVEAFEIDSDAKLTETKARASTIDTEKVLVFIDHDEKTIYLWRGAKAELFKKLMGTRVAAKLSHNYPKYRIRPITEGSEPAAFLDLLGIKRT
ncbi:MAG: hypothetical protein AM324_004930 [Candidatus Thorarchaeota archaeon SMTZ1-83]|uniref:Uncharacterized protein n=2 Tax=Candidatus Thorarchaeota archaeon SMTZ1-83 TaxID=1706445 RepID=A0ACD6B9Y8_9ARCH|nr:MAG: hypothetical protein AM324_06155 [Candidatus Thorarchaeota archaeon SMTZ1-83]